MDKKKKKYGDWYVGVKMTLPLAVPHAPKNGIVVPIPEERMMCMEIIKNKDLYQAKSNLPHTNFYLACSKCDSSLITLLITFRFHTTKKALKQGFF